jgi:hypothetical protein
MKILGLIQLVLCIFATGWFATAAHRGWKAGPPPSRTTSPSSPYYGGPHYYGGPSYSSGSRSSGGSWGGGK